MDTAEKKASPFESEIHPSHKSGDLYKGTISLLRRACVLSRGVAELRGGAGNRLALSGVVPIAAAA